MTAASLQLDARSEAQARAKVLGGAVALAVVAAICTLFSISLTRFEGGVSSLWIVNGLLTGTLLVTPKANWRWWFAATAIGQAAARLVHGETWWLALLVVAINLLESGLVAAWVRRGSDALGEDRPLGRMATDAVFGTLVGCLVSATLAAVLLIGRIGTAAPETWLTWFSAHLMGMVVVATLTVCALQPEVGLFGRAGKRIDYVLCLALLLIVSYAVFAQNRYPLLFVTYLPLMLLVWRHGMSGMMVGVVLLAGASGIAAAINSGPFVLIQDATPHARFVFWQFYLAAGCGLAYSTAVAMARRRQLERQLQRSEASYRQLAADAEHLARFDALTGVANRRHFDQSLAEAVARAHRTGSALLLFLLDLDRFKQINDSLGHAAGDALLRQFAQRVQECVFDVDLLARLGGDEFVVLVEYTPTAEAGKLIAQRLTEAMAAPFRFEGKDFAATASIGVGLHAPVHSATQLMALADRALYEAKARGRNTWVLRQDAPVAGPPRPLPSPIALIVNR